MFCNSVNYVYARDYTKLQEKEMKHAQKYETVSMYLKYNNSNNTNTNKKGLLGDYEPVDNNLFQEKLKKDEVEYAKIKEKFETRTIDNYNAEAKGEDYYRVYRIAERLIRANRLDFINWRIGIYRDSGNPTSRYRESNYISIPTSLCDTFSDNDAVIAYTIAHSMAHFLLGHDQRIAEIERKFDNVFICFDFTFCTLLTLHQRYKIESKNTEYAADVEALNLVAKAGYDLKDAMKYLVLMKTQSNVSDFSSFFPNAGKRINNCETAMKYIPIKEFNEWGKYNIYNSNVLQSELSSDRESFTLKKNKIKPNDNFYHPETPQEYYLRCAYGGYVNGEYKKSCEYFEKYFKLNTSNSQAYYYAFLANEVMYKKTHLIIYKNKAKKYEKFTKNTNPD